MVRGFQGCFEGITGGGRRKHIRALYTKWKPKGFSGEGLQNGKPGPSLDDDEALVGVAPAAPSTADAAQNGLGHNGNGAPLVRSDLPPPLNRMSPLNPYRLRMDVPDFLSDLFKPQ